MKTSLGSVRSLQDPHIDRVSIDPVYLCDISHSYTICQNWIVNYVLDGSPSSLNCQRCPCISFMRGPTQVHTHISFKRGPTQVHTHILLQRGPTQVHTQIQLREAPHRCTLFISWRGPTQVHTHRSNNDFNFMVFPNIKYQLLIFPVFIQCDLESFDCWRVDDMLRQAVPEFALI